MDKMIVFTVKRVPHGLKVVTTSALADEEDRWTLTFSVCLMSTMERLTMKYNQRDISVLFEVE